MNITIKELANELDINKQKLYRHIKKNYNDLLIHEGNKMVINKKLKALIIKDFSNKKINNDNEKKENNNKDNNKIIDLLEQELKDKNNQIYQLQELLKNEQILHLNTNQKLIEIESKTNHDTKYKKSIFGFYRKIEG